MMDNTGVSNGPITKNPHNKNAPMLKHRKGDLNEIAKQRAEHIATLSHENFQFLKRVGVVAGKLVRNKGGVQTYAYS